MKKNVLIMLLTFVLVVSSCNVVYATSIPVVTDSDTEYGATSDEEFKDFYNNLLYESRFSSNETGQVYEGYANFYRKDISDQYSSRSYSLSLDSSDGYMYIVYYPGESNTYSYYRVFGSGTLTSVQTYNYDNGETLGTTTYEPYVHTLGDFGVPSTKFYSLYDWKAETTAAFLLNTNIPVFRSDNEDAIKAYIESGDYSGAVNKDDVTGGDNAYTDEYDESIPLPHDLKIIKGVDQSVTGVSTSFITQYNHDIVLSWKQEDCPEGMQFEVEGNFFYKRLSDSDYTEMQEMNDGFKKIVNKTDYGDADKSMTLTIGKSTLNGFISRGIQTKVQFRVRNVMGNKTSNWVLITLDIANKTATATEQSYDDNADTGGEEYNDDNVNYDPDSPNSAINVDNFSIDGIMSYIKSGFGLLGNNGIIALMSQTYLYLPASIWTIIKFFISMLIVICVIKLIKEVLL